MTAERRFQHAWVLPHEIDEASWVPLRRDATIVLRASSAVLEVDRSPAQPGVLRGPHGLGLPEVSVDRIALNGSSFRGESGDAFVLERRATAGVLLRAGRGSTGRSVRRCDTRGQPYDLAVCALLLVAKDHLGESMRLGSSAGLLDGWRAAAGLVRHALGRSQRLVQSEEGILAWLPDARPASPDLRERSSA